jgi:RNA-directed DNA polymerase
VFEALPEWFRQRRYIHFDQPLSYKKAAALVKDPKAVASHPFWPLIRFNVETVKIKRDPTTGTLALKQKVRDISYAAHGDSQVLSYYCSQLADCYESEVTHRGLNDVVLAFRPLGKNNIDFAKMAFDEIRARGDCSVVALDITKFFDTLAHNQLKLRWKSLLGAKELPADHFSIFRTLTKFSFVDRDELFEALGISIHNPRAGRQRLCSPAEFRSKVRDAGLITTNDQAKGIPQGTAISALLSNIYMLEFDSNAQMFASSHGGRYMRYCDDMLFIMPPGMADETESFAENEISMLELEINPAKTDKCEFYALGGQQNCNHPLQYLGFLFDGRKIIIRSAAL